MNKSTAATFIMYIFNMYYFPHTIHSFNIETEANRKYHKLIYRDIYEQ